MTNKVIAIFEDHKAIKMQRYENDVKVGEKSMLPAEYFLKMASNLTPGALMSLLVNDRGFEMYLSTLYEENNFEEFITTVLKNVPSYYLKDPTNPILVSIVHSVISNIRTFNDIDGEALSLFIKVLLNDSNITFNMDLLDLTKHLLTELIKNANASGDENVRIVRMSIFKMMYQALTKDQKKIEKDLLYSIISGFSKSEYREFVDTTREFLDNREVCEFENVIPDGCSYLFKTNKRTIYGFELKKSRYRIKFHNQLIGEIGHPRLAFFYVVNELGRVISMRVFALKDDGKRLSADSDLFQYPFSNVYGNGEVCWGEKTSFSIEDMSFAASGFLMANNTGHLLNDAMDNLKKFKDADFDDDILIYKGTVEDTL